MADDDDGDKTEDPTQKKIDDAKKKGQFAKSKEFISFVVLFFGMGGLLAIGPEKAITTKAFTITMFRWIPEVADNPRQALVSALFSSVQHLWEFLAIPLIFLWIMTIFFGMANNRFIIPEEALKFDVKKLDPISGFKEKFMSLNPVVELVKSLIKLFLLGYVVYSIIASAWPGLPHMIYANPEGILLRVRDLVSRIFWSCMPLIIIVIVMDFSYQWYDNNKKLKMSKQEIKDEQKQAEGNPEVKSKQKQKRREFALASFRREVPKADVIVVNPTHYSVAIRYNPEESDAPRVVAKGVDFMAMRIRQLAGQHNVPIVENPPLARGLYAQTKEGQPIHPDFYPAVAEILAVIYRRQGKARPKTKEVQKMA